MSTQVIVSQIWIGNLDCKPAEGELAKLGAPGQLEGRGGLPRQEEEGGGWGVSGEGGGGEEHQKGVGAGAGAGCRID